MPADRSHDDGSRTSRWADAQRQQDAERFAKWKRDISESHDGAQAVVNDRVYWTQLDKPLADCSVAMVSSLGVHRRSDPPFDVLDPQGDTSIRFLPGDIGSGELMATHGHVDTNSANRDINVGFPIDRLREFAAEGRIGAVAPTHFGIMGWCPQVERMRDEVAPRIVERLRSDDVDAVLLIPG